MRTFDGSMSEYYELLEEMERNPRAGLAQQHDDAADAADASSVERDGDAGAPDDDPAARAAAAAAERKRRVNAPKRIAKLEGLIETKEARVGALDGDLVAAGADAARAAELYADRAAAQAQVDELYAEWEELSELLLEKK